MNYKLTNVHPDFPNKPACIIATDENGVKYAIPVDNSNTDYKKYLEWLSNGNTPEPAE